MRRLLALVPILLLAGGGSAWAKARPKLNPDEEHFYVTEGVLLNRIHDFNRNQMKMGERVQQQGDPRLHDFGAAMVHDYAQNDRKLMELAQERNLVLNGARDGILPRQVNQDIRHDIKQRKSLDQVSDNTFDQHWLTDVIVDHQESLELLTQSNASNWEVPIKRFLEETAPLVEGHLQQAKDLRANPGENLSGAGPGAGPYVGPPALPPK
jgi:predicted outer membrane protein